MSTDITNKQMTAGQKLERFVAEWFADENGYEYVHARKQQLFGLQKNPKNCIYKSSKMIMRHKSEPIFLASQDYNYAGNEVLEIKSTINQSEEIDSSWFAQSQWYCGVTGHTRATVAWVILPFNFNYELFNQIKWVDIKVLRTVLKYRQETYPADNNFIHHAQVEALRFWNNHVLKGIPPEPQTESDLKLLYPKAVEGKQIEAVDDVYSAWEQLCQVMDEKKIAEKTEEQMKLNLKKILVDAELLSYGEKILATYKNIAKVVVDTDKLKADGLYEKYSKLSEYRTLSIKR
jgi:hypothetical protein